MRYFLLLFIAGFCFTAAPARAQGGSELVRHCGTPESVSINTKSNVPLCDAYSRQLAYKKEADSFSNQLRERQESFAAPSRSARENYQEQMDALHFGKAEDKPAPAAEKD